MSTISFIIDNIIVILIASTIFSIIIYYFDKKEKTAENIDKNTIKKRNWTYLGRVEFLSFFPKPIIVLGVIAFWGGILLLVYLFTFK